MLALGEMFDVFRSNTGDITLMHDTDAGDLTLTTNNEQVFLEVIESFSSLPTYLIEYANGT